jgi:hypothetical protein
LKHVRRRSTLIKIAVGLALVALFGVLFVRSVRNVAAAPYTVARSGLAGWTVALDPAVRESGVLLALWPPDTLAPPLFSQLFTRSGISLTGPNPVAMPLVLQSEFEGALAGRVAPDGLVELARESGLESIQPKPLCMASRRASEPGSNRQVYFVRFEHLSFGEFRRQIAARVNAAGANATGFDPTSLSPVVIVAASDVNFRSWLPLRGDASEGCVAPIVVQ